MEVIPVDFNNFDENGNMPLMQDNSLKSLSKIGDENLEGKIVLLSDGELWAKAVLHLAEDGIVEARSFWCFHKEAPE